MAEIKLFWGIIAFQKVSVTNFAETKQKQTVEKTEMHIKQFI